MKMLGRALVVSGLTSLAACTVDLHLPESATISCSNDAHCGAGQVCLVEQTDGRCVARGTPCVIGNGSHHVLAVGMPSALQATLQDDAIALTWTSPDQAQSIIERKDLGADWRELWHTSTPATNYQDSEVALDTVYEYRIRASSDDCRSAPSNEVKVFSRSRRPLELEARALDAATVALTWFDANTWERHYLLERRSGSEPTFAQLAELPPDTASFLDGGLPPGTVYEYRLSAMNPDGVPSEPALVTGWTLQDPLVRNDVLMNEDFEDTAVGALPAGWSPHPPATGLYCDLPTDFSSGHPFAVELVDLEKVLATSYGDQGCVNAYYAVGESTAWQSYHYSGRMRRNQSSSIGVTVYTQQPELQKHYLLASHENNPFRLELPGPADDTICRAAWRQASPLGFPRGQSQRSDLPHCSPRRGVERLHHLRPHAVHVGRDGHRRRGLRAVAADAAHHVPFAPLHHRPGVSHLPAGG